MTAGRLGASGLRHGRHLAVAALLSTLPIGVWA
jgi:hypothetical protein